MVSGAPHVAEADRAKSSHPPSVRETIAGMGGPPGEFELMDFIIFDPSRSPSPNAQAGRKILAGVSESRSPGSTKRVLTTSGAMAFRKLLL